MGQQFGKTLMLLGVVIFAVGLVWHLGGKFGLGQLPGDIAIKRKNFSLYIPITTSILLSVLLSMLFWWLRRK